MVSLSSKVKGHSLAGEVGALYCLSRLVSQCGALEDASVGRDEREQHERSQS